MQTAIDLHISKGLRVAEGRLNKKEKEISSLVSSSLGLAEMVTTGLKDRDILDETSNFGAWKATMRFLLDEHGLKEFVESAIVIRNRSSTTCNLQERNGQG